MAKLVIFTDLDGTLLGEEDEVSATVADSLDRLVDAGILLVPVSARTQVEVQHVMAQLHLEGPFITENGSAVFIPKDHFPFAFPFQREAHVYKVLELGVPYATLRRFLDDLPPIENLEVRGFGDMTLDEVASVTGLDLWASARAKRREYDETLILDGPPGSLERFAQVAQTHGFRVTHGGRFHHLLGPTDKGRAVQVFLSLMAKAGEKVTSAAIGNADNDHPMLGAVDIPVWLAPVDAPGSIPRGKEGVRFLAAPAWDRAIDQILCRAGVSV